MRKACIAIGVDEVRDVPKLAKLRAASQGAEQFARWAKQSDPSFETQCITDRTGAVTVGEIKRVVEQIVTSRSYDQLIVYFAGHGILKTWDTEMWLLSRAAADANEAVNLVGSVRYARHCGIPHVIFVSDACRSVPADPTLAQVDGNLIFPPRRVPHQRPPEIDIYYASLPGDPSYEIPADEANRRYDGVFTKFLLEGLKGGEPALRESIDEDRRKMDVVSSRTLKPWLEEKVQDAVTSVSVELEQIPEIRVESQRPKYVTRWAGVPARSGADGSQPPAPRPSPPPMGSPLSSAAVLRNLAEDNGVADLLLRDDEFPPRLITETRPDTKLNREIDQLLAAKGRESFETRTGFTLVGSQVTGAFVNGEAGGSDVFDEAGAQQIRVYDGPHARSVLIQFPSGNGTCLAALPGYIGTVVVENDCVVNVSYAPSRNSYRWQDYQFVKDDLERRRAFTAVAARRGIFKIEQNSAASFAQYIRQLKSIDPTLGIYAAYAYSQTGRADDVESVYDWMRSEHDVPVPFDVALLADHLVRPTLIEEDSYAPRTPMLTQGWAFLHEDLQIPKWLLEARRYTLPSLWTTFSPQGFSFVKEMISRRT
jgi:hypothetical protein